MTIAKTELTFTSQVIVHHWIVDVILDLFNGKVRVNGILFRDLADKVGFEWRNR